MTSHLVVCFVACVVLTVLVTALPVDAKTPGPSANAAPVLRRYALVIGSNEGGGAGRVKLRYADHDAATVADVLQQLGGVTKPDLALLREPDTAAPLRTLACGRKVDACSAGCWSWGNIGVVFNIRK